MSQLTPFQTIGPFFEVLLRTRGPQPPPGDGVAGTRVAISGTLLDGSGQPIPDGLVEVWQADAQGRYRHPEALPAPGAGDGFTGYTWSATDDEGRFRVDTIKPGPVEGPEGRLQAPHLLVGVMARGILTRYVTRAYFDDEPSNGADPILSIVPPPRRHTLLAVRVGPGAYRFDIRVQGADETVFFDV